MIVAGDLTARDTHIEYQKFFDWFKNQSYKKKIFIAGNHDNKLTDFYCCAQELIDFEYLCDSGTEFEGLKIWGSPWTTRFPGINPLCCAFTVNTDQELSEKWDLIPKDTDILITHSPSFGNYDYVNNRNSSIVQSVGSLSLWIKSLEILPKLHVFGHIHEAYGNCTHYNGIRLVNCSHVNERYQPVNKPIRIIL